MEIDEIITVLEIFKRAYSNLDDEEKARRLGMVFKVSLHSTEIYYPNQKLAEIIQVRLEQDEVCPKCEGFGCEICRDTGKKNIYQ